MAAMKPRTGDGPMEAVKEGRLIIVRVPLEGGGRLVVSVNDAATLASETSPGRPRPQARASAALLPLRRICFRWC